MSKTKKRWSVMLAVVMMLSVFQGWFGGQVLGVVSEAQQGETSLLAEVILSDPGFETAGSASPPVGWALSEASQWNGMFGSSEEAYAGARSVYITRTGGTGWLYMQHVNRVTLTPGLDYRLSAWVKVDDPQMSGQPLLNLDFYGDTINPATDDYWVGALNQRLDATEMTGDWQQLVLDFQMPAGAQEAIVYLVLDGVGTVHFDEVQLVEQPVAGNGDYLLWTPANQTDVWTRTSEPPTEAAEPALLFDMAAREYQSRQVMAHGQDGSASITAVTASDLVSGSHTIPASDLQILVQHYVEVTVLTNNAYGPGQYPDALVPLAEYLALHGSIEVPEDENQAIWLTVYTDAATPAGIYQGELTLTINGEASEVPVAVRVRDFALPAENHAQTAFAIWGWMLPYGYPGLIEGSEDYWQLMRNYYDFLLDYHVTPTDLPIPADDYEDFVAQAAAYVNDPRVSAYRLPYTVGDFENGRAADLVADLDAAGLLEKAYYYLGQEIDEPTPAMYPLVNQRSQQIAAIDPDLRHIVTTGLHDDLIDDVNTFSPQFHEFLDEDYLSRAHLHQAAGGHMWWYGCVSPKHPYPTYHLDDDLLTARLASWMQHAYGIEGNLYWAVNIYQKYDGTQYVARDIWHDPLAFPGANGDGYLLYPGAKYGIDGPIATLRLQTIRDGNQDYEYLRLLEERVAQAAAALGVTVDAADVLQVYYDRLFADVRTFLKDGDRFGDVRRDIADLIEALDAEPAVLITVIDDPADWSKKEIQVYAAQGATVTIDGQTATAAAIPGNPDTSLYVRVVDVAVGDNTIAIEITKGGVTQSLTRHILVRDRTLEPVYVKQVVQAFTDASSLAGIVAEHGAVVQGLSTEHAGEGVHSLRVSLPHVTGEAYPGFSLPMPTATQDVSAAHALVLDVYNDASSNIDLFVKWFDGNGQASDHKLATLQPGANTVTLLLEGLDPQLDRANIASLLFWTHAGNQARDLYIGDIHLLVADALAIQQREIGFTPILPELTDRLDGSSIWTLPQTLNYRQGNTEAEAVYDVRYSEDHLYLAVHVEDAEVVDADTVELFIDGYGGDGNYTPLTSHYAFAYGGDQVKAYGAGNLATAGIAYRFEPTNDGYTWQAAIPFRTLGFHPSAGKVVRFSLQIVDATADKPSAGRLGTTEPKATDASSLDGWADKVFADAGTLVPFVVKEAAAAGSIVIDGMLDEEAWELPLLLGHHTYGTVSDPGNQANLGLSWDHMYLYAAFDVTDSLVHAPQERPVWEESSVELFIDGDWTKGARNERAPQYTFRYNDEQVYLNGSPMADRAGILHATQRTDAGYRVEAAIPWSAIGGMTPQVEKPFGLTAHVNFYQDSGGVYVRGLTVNGLQDGTTTANYMPVQLMTRDSEAGTDQPAQSSEVITRAEFVHLLLQTLSAQATVDHAREGTATFADAAQIEDWAIAPMQQAWEAGWLSGYADGRVRAHEAITRAEMAVLLARVLGLNVTSAGTVYADQASIPPWAQEAVHAVTDAGLLGGHADGQFHALQIVTRSQAEAVIGRLQAR